jgi:hypothetical protein
MKVSKALRAVMLRWELTNYQVSKESGVDSAAIGRILDGKAEGTTWINVEKIAKGLEKIDPIAKIAFLGALALPDDALPDDILMILAKQKQQIKKTNKTIVVLDELSCLNQSNVDSLKANLQQSRGKITFEEFIYMKEQNTFFKHIPEAEILKPNADNI